MHESASGFRSRRAFPAAVAEVVGLDEMALKNGSSLQGGIAGLS
jgi:hypothetical protein